MTSIIKNQLVKHLSKFTKNLKPEQISLDVLKGNSKLQFIEINEDVLTEILELPSWLKIKKAYCTGVAVNVPWTKLKTCPIQIFIDEINVDVELTNEQKKQTKSNPLGNLGDSSSYGFMNKIIENMSLYISSVEINFDSDVFGGSFMLQRLSVESRSPGWAQVKDLRQTRITCSTTNRTLMFKQLSWHLLRIEASAKSSKNEQRSKINAPLRLITSGGKIRIALKKNATDGSVIHARIQTILDDILWVATLPQLRSAISFASYIANLVKESQKNDVITTTNSHESPFIRTADKDVDAKTTTSAYNIFHFDQTSYHLHVKKIDLHLCDDAHTASDYPPDWDIDSGAMQVTLHQVLIDVYPKAHAHSDRSTWMRYPNPNPIAGWFKSHLTEQFLTLLGNAEDQTTKTRLERCWPQLIGFFLVLRVHDLTVQCVSDMNTKKDALTNLFESERHLHSLPSDQQIVHVEFGTFYHPHSDKLPVPNSAVYFQLGPFTVSFDERTTRWCCYVVHALGTAIEDGHLIPEKELDIVPPTVKISLLMPRVVLNLPGPFTDFNFPRRLVTSMSSLTVSSSPIDFKDNNRFITLGRRNTEEHHEIKNQLTTGPNRFHLSTSPVWIEIDHGPQTKGFPFLHDVSFNGIVSVDKDLVNLLVEPIEDISIVLTRLGEKFTKFFDQLSLDMKHYNVGKPPSDVRVDFLAAIERIRVYIVLTMGEIASPYDQAAMNNFNHSFMDRLSGLLGDLRQAIVWKPEQQEWSAGEGSWSDRLDGVAVEVQVLNALESLEHLLGDVAEVVEGQVDDLDLLELIHDSVVESLEVVLVKVQVMKVWCVDEGSSFDVGDVVSVEGEHGEGSQVGQIVLSENLDLVVFNMKSNQVVHVSHGLAWESSHAVTVQNQVLKRKLHILEGVWSHIADLIASQIDVDEGSHVDESLLGDVSDLVALQAKDVEHAESGESLGWDLLQAVLRDGQLLHHIFESSECVLVDVLDSVFVKIEFLDSQVLESAWADLK